MPILTTVQYELLSLAPPHTYKCARNKWLIFGRLFDPIFIQANTGTVSCNSPIRRL